jgi:ubiquinol-cytochrome c reductase subunit 7
MQWRYYGSDLLQASLAHQLLPKEQHTKPEEVRLGYVPWNDSLLRFYQDYQYLSPIIKQIEAEAKERDDLDSLAFAKKA